MAQWRQTSSSYIVEWQMNWDPFTLFQTELVMVDTPVVISGTCSTGSTNGCML
jgi:hypothetical protein